MRARLYTARRRVWLLAIVAGLAVLLAGCSAFDQSTPGPTNTPLPGTVFDPPRELTDFTLTDQSGQPFHLHDLNGKVAVVFFGYTHCPDVCPTTLSDFKRVKAALGDNASKVAFVFVSVDGSRDTPERLTQYVGAFDPDFIGLTGQESYLHEIGRDYGLFFQRSTYDNTQEDYLVDHTASSFIIGPQGRLRITYPYQTETAIVVQGIENVLAEG